MELKSSINALHGYIFILLWFLTLAVNEVTHLTFENTDV